MRIALACVLTGCFGQLTAGQTLQRGSATGAIIEGALGDDGVRVTAQYTVEKLATSYGTSELGVSASSAMRVSLPGVIFGAADRSHWLDLGADLGWGFGFHGQLNPFGCGFVGGWADVRLWPRTAYPSLRVQVRRIGYLPDVDNETQFLVGVSWTNRRLGAGAHPE